MATGFISSTVSRLCLGFLLVPAFAAAQGPVVVGQGTASYYRADFRGQTASGEAYHPELFTASHATLPLGSWVRVTNLKSGQSVLVRINDRSPYIAGNLIDVSRAAAEKLDLLRDGYADVSVTLLAAAPPAELGAAATEKPVPTQELASGPSPKGLTPVSGSLPPPVNLPKAASTEPTRPVLRVQFGAFHELASAIQTQEELRALGVETVIYRRENTLPGEPLFRLVTSGGFAEQAAADRWLDYMKRKSGRYPEAYVTR